MNHKYKTTLKYIGYAASLIALVIAILFLYLVFAKAAYADKTVPNQFISTTKVSRLDESELSAKLDQIIQEKIEQNLVFDYDSKTFEIPIKELPVGFDKAETLTKVKFYESEVGLKDIASDLFHSNKISLKADYDKEALIQAVESRIDNLKLAKNARFQDINGQIEIEPEESGFAIKEEDFISKFEEALIGQNLFNPLEIEVEAKDPEIKTTDLEPLKDRFVQLISSQILLQTNDEPIEFNLQQNLDNINFVESDSAIAIKLNPDEVTIFLKEKVDPKVNREPDTLQITYDGQNVQFSGIGHSGKQLNHDQLIRTLEETLNTKLSESSFDPVTLSLPLDEIDPILIIDQELQDMGIKEIIATGYTTYYGSPGNRMHNIEVGMKQFNGTIIQKDEEFSFNKTLGHVDGSTGYLPELVIKPEGTIPEFGGGLCQVSTTFYRGALNAGLDILDRAPHSYAVSYYSQVGGHGLDATIYPPARDLIVQNNTPGAILLQTFTDGPQAYYRFFGTNDGRRIELDGPYISNYRSTAKVEYIEKPDLAPGETRQVEYAHTGFDALWYRKIIRPSGEEVVEEINSVYKAVPAKYWIGPGGTQQEQ